jgi:O-antigen ligase
MLGGIIFLAVQSAMTFSRGGLYNAVTGAVLAFLFLIRDIRRQAQLVLVGALLYIVADYILLPRLDAFTQGALSARFQDVNPSGRDSIVQSDLQIWEENPILGVGPGQAKSYRELQGVAAHTEFTRVLAEHGVLGLVALLLLLIAGVQNLRRAHSPRDKALAASMMGWSLFFMLNSAMRLVAPAFTFGLAFTPLLPGERRGLQSAPNHGYKTIRRLAFSHQRGVFERHNL